MMRGCNVPNSEQIINKYDETGCDIYWYQFIELMGAETLRKHIEKCSSPKKNDNTSNVSQRR
jgi:hypothetical protein